MIQEKHLWIIEELKELKRRGLISKPRMRGSKGYANFPIKWSVEGNFADYAFKERKVKNKAFASFSLDKGRGGIVFIDLASRKKGAHEELKKTLKDKNYIRYRKELTDKYAKQLEVFSRTKLSEKNVSGASKKELMELYNKFREIYTKYEFYNNIWFSISEELSEEIIQRLKDKGCTDFEEIHTIFTPTFQSFVNKETIDLLSAAIALKDSIKGRGYEDFMQRADAKLLEDLAANYHWIPFGHIGPQLYDEKHYFNEIQRSLSEGKNLKSELKRAQTFYAGIKKEHLRIYKKYKIDKETQRLIADLHILSQLQDERKETIAKTHINWVNNLMTEIGKYFQLTGMEAAELYPEVIERCLLKGKIDISLYNKEQVSHRRFEITEPDGYTTYFDDDAEPFLRIIEADDDTGLKGTCASRGKAKGIVRVLKSAYEIDRVNPGEILVVTMTTPDYVPAMRRAAGIITDEGGITCHAAIVSREFGIPCIIGTKNATQMLKDGEYIEMDADKGTIDRMTNHSKRDF